MSIPFSAQVVEEEEVVVVELDQQQQQRCLIKTFLARSTLAHGRQRRQSREQDVPLRMNCLQADKQRNSCMKCLHFSTPTGPVVEPPPDLGRLKAIIALLLRTNDECLNYYDDFGRLIYRPGLVIGKVVVVVCFNQGGGGGGESESSPSSRGGIIGEISLSLTF